MQTMVTPAAGPDGARREVAVLLGYFALYLCYLFAYQESEAVHWLTLVALPLVLIGLLRPRTDTPIRDTLASVGLSTSTWKNGLSWAVPLGILLSLAQLIVSDRSAELLALIRSGDALYLFPVVLLFLLVTAGFTEEVFFRGVIQTRLGMAWESRFWAVLVTSVLFGLYHVPYAYFNPNWGSHGQWDAAIASAMSQGIIGGLILGAVYERAGRNLLASIVVHALINALPAMTMIKFN
jgi:membrane protease YdiL (CAAX protease family)